jgi:GNAT superfamily N-acetyltransferase
MISTRPGGPEHAPWIESSLRRSQDGASFVSPVRVSHVLTCDVIVATLLDAPDEWIGWIATSGDIVAYLYVREAVRRNGVASELLALAAAAADVTRLRAATWTRGADRLSKRISYSHHARSELERATPNPAWIKCQDRQQRITK